MAILSRDAILSSRAKLRTQEVDVPEWGGSVVVREMSGAERDAFEESMVVQRGKSREVNLKNLRARLVAFTVCGEDGKRLFSERDIEELGELSAAALNRVWDVARKLSGMSDDDVEELAGN